MKKLWILILTIIIIQNVYSKEKIILGITIKKYNIRVKYKIEIIKDALENLGYDLELEVLPSERSLIMANLGQIDGDIGRIGDLEKRYKNLRQLKDPIGKFSYYIYYNKKLKVETLKEIIDKKLSIIDVIGVKLIDSLLKDGSENRIIQAWNFINALMMLDAGRADAFIVSNNIVDSLIEEHKLKNIKRSKNAVIKRNLFIYLNKKHKNLAEKLNTEIIRLIKEKPFRESDFK